MRARRANAGCLSAAIRSRSPFPVRRRPHPLIVLLCALFLLGAQQAAYAHFIGHLGSAAETTAQEGGDAGHGAAATLAHVCTTCAAFAALGMAPPAAPPSLPANAVPTSPIRPPAASRIAVPAVPPCGARAPPIVL